MTTTTRLAVTLWGALLLAGMLTWLAHGTEWLLAALDDEPEHDRV